MKRTSDSTSPPSVLWTDGVRTPRYAPLDNDDEADVCIVGAGIAGLTTAYQLTHAGKSVIVLDDGKIASGMSGVTSAHLSNEIDDRYVEIERLHGEHGARLAAESHTAAIDQIEAIVSAENIDCDFERLDGYLFLAPGEKAELLEREVTAAQRAGVAAELLSSVPVSWGSAIPCVRFPRQAQFHPLKYLAGLSKAVSRDGVRIFTDTHADDITGGRPAKVTAGGHVVTADAVVVATNAPVNDLFAMHTKQAPYMTYVIAAEVPRGAVTRALYWDTQDPYHYVRLHPAANGRSSRKELLLVGGEDHKTGQADDTTERYDRLEAWARAHFRELGKVAFRWAGQVMESMDGLAFIGRNPLDSDNVFIVTGDSGMGLTHGTIAGILLTDLIVGRENPWERLYDPSRKTLRAGGEFVKENLNVAGQYTDWVTGGEVDSANEIARDAGAIIRRGMSKIAVYRDARGQAHELSAVCPHLGCIVHWNAAEKSWDCPCHGSRFDKLGKVFNGPANSDLAAAKDE